MLNKYKIFSLNLLLLSSSVFGAATISHSHEESTSAHNLIGYFNSLSPKLRLKQYCEIQSIINIMDILESEKQKYLAKIDETLRRDELTKIELERAKLKSLIYSFKHIESNSNPHARQELYETLLLDVMSLSTISIEESIRVLTQLNGKLKSIKNLECKDSGGWEFGSGGQADECKELTEMNQVEINSNLQQAVLDGDIAYVTELIKFATDVNAIDEGNGKTVLMNAVSPENKYSNKQRYLNKLFDDIGVGSHSKISDTRMEEVKKMLEEYASNICATNKYNIVKLLLNAGAKVNNVGGEKGTNALMEASMLYGDENIVKLLLDNKADVNMVDNELGYLALTYATNNLDANEHTVKLLFDAGADINATDNDGWTSLMHAAARGDENIVKLLLRSGANLDNRDKRYKKTAADCARGWAKDKRDAIIKLLNNEPKRRMTKFKEYNTALIKKLIERNIPSPLSALIAGYAIADYHDIAQVDR